MSKRIALYWHDGRGLGHTVRNATLGQALLNSMPGSAVLGITGAAKGLELLPLEMDFVKIPSYLAFDGVEGVHTMPILSITKAKFQSLRENLIATVVRDLPTGARHGMMLSKNVERAYEHGRRVSTTTVR